jgi:hypothetical protein
MDIVEPEIVEPEPKNEKFRFEKMIKCSCGNLFRIEEEKMVCYCGKEHLLENAISFVYNVYPYACCT